MPTRDEAVPMLVDGEHLDGTLIAPSTRMPAFLFVHGWGGSQEQYLARAREIAALGCICLTFDLRGHANSTPERADVTPDDNLRDVLAAYDALVRQRFVDPDAIGLVGSSYGGFLAARVTALRPVRWLALRVPALYRNEDWSHPKRGLDREALSRYRRRPLRPDENRVLGAAERFAGDVLIVESEHDSIVPHETVASWLGAFRRARSLTHRVIEGADHGLSDPASQQSYTKLLVHWTTEMVTGERRTIEAGRRRGAPDIRGEKTPTASVEDAIEELVSP
jgi:pimeloyl-ACP methyl ester carboxylesterase